MGEANKDGFADDLIFMRNNYRNFDQKFTTPNSEFSDSEQIDLSLGLSLGGLYSRIPKEKPLIRASSLNGDLTLMNENEESWGFLSLARSASLPTEAEHELRKLKELQALNRLVEKHRHSRGGTSQEEKPLLAGAKLSNWAIDSTSRETMFCCAIEELKSNVTPSTNIRIEGPGTLPQSTVTSRSLESGISEHVVTGTMANGKSAYPANHHSAPLVALAKMASGKRVNSANSHADSAVSFMTRVNGKPVDQLAETKQERQSKKFKALANGIQDITMMEMMKLMPSVTTTGDGPNGKTIEGFLYRYKKGQVSIVCVCHGNFLSPAEFFRHAGGTDVANPMKHINVLPATL